MKHSHSDAASVTLLVFAGLFGAAGTAGAAYAAHATASPLAAVAAAIAFVHAPALLALALAPPSMIAARAIPGAMLIAGVLLFSGDLATRIATGGRLFANAAPSGGMMLMAGWLAIAACAVIAFLRRPR
ncbi:Uncharacterized membrane protein YgdD, TMEM256/DUF423 family [Aureimonas altamirensis DSM 21988]|uniref:Uncharacterized membrane protein YgdD, TMEM256/DUF423 family n=1 Tax=Aureimonas altamirensis DSM 21988 TaxID=1121026 RepID=A0ABY1IIU5_9HYPH|nr:DUF423 domain-containing protein [Aureimonas altamirensis]SHJ23742.1 Uncharacterized membrane protein YgdD, TMEM256/DUF423 family [Aureimonas altamirensis DSM 21988]